MPTDKPPYEASTGFYSGAALTSLDETWATPRAFYDELNAEFGFTLDAAALAQSTLVPGNWFGPDHPDPARRDALACDWVRAAQGGAVWLNPPYGRVLSKWMSYARRQADAGVTVVCLVPARTDTRWMWSNAFDRGAEVRFVRGRLKFGDGQGTAPFPSAVIILRPADQHDSVETGQRREEQLELFAAA